MLAAASTIRPPSIALEKYSALSCPKACSSSAGFSAMVIITRATTAAARFTPDSSASESSPTEPVRAHAADFRPMVASAAAIDR